MRAFASILAFLVAFSASATDFVVGQATWDSGFSFTAVDATYTIDTGECSDTLARLTDASGLATVRINSCPQLTGPVGECAATSDVSSAASPWWEPITHPSTILRVTATTAPTSSATLDLRCVSYGRLTGQAKKVATGGSTAMNVPTDLSGDGAPDYVRVFGDYDGNGELDQEDFHRAQAALTETSAQRVVHFMAGIYTADTSDFPAYTQNPGDQQIGRHTIWRIKSNTTVLCEPGVKFVGIGIGGESDEAWSVIGGDRSEGAAGTWHNDNVKIIGCEIDGGMPASYDWTDADGKQRIGIRTHDCIGCEIRDVYVHDTLHTGILMAGWQDGRVSNIRTQRTGFYGDTSGPENHPAVELSIRPFDTYQGTFGNEIDGVTIEKASQGFKGGSGDFLVDDDSDVIENYQNIVRNLYVEDSETCTTVGNTRDWVFDGVTCNNAGRGPIKTGPTDWYPNDIAANKNLTIRNYSSFNNETVKSSNSTFFIPSHQTNLTLENIKIDTSEPVAGESCVEIDMPTFVNINGLDVANCNTSGAGGIRFDSAGSTTTSGVTLGPVGHVYIKGLDMENCNGSGCIYAQDGFEKLHIDGGYIQDPRAIAIQSQAGNDLVDVIIENLEIDTLPYPTLFQGEGTVANLTGITCNSASEGIWGVATDATNRTSTTGGGSTRNRLRCESSSWVDWPYTTFEPIVIDQSESTSSRVIFRNLALRAISNTNSNADRFGIEMDNSGFTNFILNDIACYAESEGQDTYAEHCVEGHASQTGMTVDNVVCFGPFSGGCETVP